MSNSYFQFKQFKIEQSDCAMKVSTDACIQGAWTPIDNTIKTVLDIGTGTGLLSLLLAQRNEYIKIEGVELDYNAAHQAKENAIASSWSDRLGVEHIDIKSFVSEKQFDMIICNPPFFQNSLQGEQASRNMARHTDSLSYKDLLVSIDRLLSKDGYASIMLPVSEFEIWNDLLQSKNWHVSEKLIVQPREGQKHNRVVSLCRRGSLQECNVEELCIYDTNGYTDAFAKLMKPYYLSL